MGTRYLLALAIVLATLFVAAQPLFKSENNWTITVGGWKFGLQGVKEIPGDFYHTQIWFGPRHIDLHHWRPFEVLIFVLGPPAAAILRYRDLVNAIHSWPR